MGLACWQGEQQAGTMRCSTRRAEAATAASAVQRRGAEQRGARGSAGIRRVTQAAGVGRAVDGVLRVESWRMTQARKTTGLRDQCTACCLHCGYLFGGVCHWCARKCGERRTMQPVDHPLRCGKADSSGVSFVGNRGSKSWLNMVTNDKG